MKRSTSPALSILSLSIILSAAFSLFYTPASAQESFSDSFCSEYRPGMVSIQSTTSGTTKASAGTSVDVPLSLHNRSGIPVSDGSLMAVIRKLSQATGSIYDQAEVVVDRIFIDDINLDVEESKNIDFSWSVPASAASGDYAMEFYFLSNDRRFQLSGASYLEGFAGLSDSVVKIEVSGVGRGGPFLKNTATEPVTVIEKAGAASVIVSAGNPLSKTISIPVVWKAYAGDSLNDSEVVNSKIEVVTIPAGQTKNVSYALADEAHHSYQVVAELQYEGLSSYSSTYLVRPQVSEPVIRVAGVSGFSAASDNNAPLRYFACVDMTGSDFRAERTIDLSLSVDGKEVSSASFAGSETPMQRVEAGADVGRDYKNLVISGKVLAVTGGTKTFSIKYECGSFGSGCVASSRDIGSGSRLLSDDLYLITTASALVAVIGLLYVVKRRNKVIA